MTKIYLVLISFLSIFLLTPIVFAQSSDEEIAKKYGITFPVKELGNCNSIANCEAFCNLQENWQTCTNFAKSKGLHQEQSTPQNGAEILKLAQKELGCNSYDDCMAFCDAESSRKKCEDFALNHNLMGGKEAGQMKQVMSTLGCNSPSSCISFCSNPTNMQKCMIAFQSAGFDTGVSNMTLDECKKLSPPDWECRLDGPTCTCSEPQEPPEVWCPKAGSDCKWKDNACFCGETLEGYCAKSPGCKFEGNTCTCTEGSSSEEWCSQLGPNCKWDGQQCNCGLQGGSDESLQDFCSKQGANCKVEGGSCVCSETPTVSAEPIESWCPKAGAGCRVEGNDCICDSPQDTIPTYGTPAYETPTYPTPEESGFPSSKPTVQGAKTVKGLLQLLWDQIGTFLSKP